jgi:hypothetical protein
VKYANDSLQESNLYEKGMNLTFCLLNQRTSEECTVSFSGLWAALCSYALEEHCEMFYIPKSRVTYSNYVSTVGCKSGFAVLDMPYKGHRGLTFNLTDPIRIASRHYNCVLGLLT